MANCHTLSAIPVFHFLLSFVVINYRFLWVSFPRFSGYNCVIRSWRFRDAISVSPENPRLSQARGRNCFPFLSGCDVWMFSLDKETDRRLFRASRRWNLIFGSAQDPIVTEGICRKTSNWDKSTVTEINSQQCTFHETATCTRLLNAFRSILKNCSTYISDKKRVIFWAVNRLNARWTNHSTSALIKYSTTDQ